MSCIFCKIINGEIPSKKVYENDKVLVIEDINPSAKIHVLILSKKHIKSVNELDETNIDIIKDMFEAAKKVSIMLNIDKSGYRLINNCGSDGGQTIAHLHIHLLGGEDLGEKLI